MRLVVFLLVLVCLFAGARRLFRRAPEEAPPVASLIHRVDLNRAPWYELANLPGIGESKARRIVRDRRAHGPYRTLKDLERVAGIGPATIAMLERFPGLIRPVAPAP